jgi:hypothetical protein
MDTPDPVEVTILLDSHNNPIMTTDAAASLMTSSSITAATASAADLSDEQIVTLDQNPKTHHIYLSYQAEV